jgi:cellulose synthase/poly-beta-1,6-N-acetylglucosamine synthase-like glycosyltransferase/peptidoglycan/xylan/chitin deacetylase (PgdA/CDA1 family)/spore germination protein YaaH
MQKQIFQTNSATRWKSFIWIVRIIIVFLVVILASVGISLLNKRDYDLKVLTYNSKKLPDLNTDKTKAFVSEKDEEAFARHIEKYRKHHQNILKHRKHIKLLSSPEADKFLPVRAGFYVNWDKNSNISLHRNISHLNMVLPEWLFLKDSKANIDVRVENETLDFIQNHKVAVIPMLSNYFNKRWNGDSAFNLLKNPRERKLLISRIRNLLNKNDFQGINIDIESLPQNAHPYMLQFSKELSETLHAEGYLTTIDINPTDEGVTYKDFAQYYDFIFLMAYNEHSPDDPPGSISSLNFVEASMDAAMKEVASKKIILCLASYGFDWEKGKPGTRITYQSLISTAKEMGEPVYFNFSQSDLTLYYTDDNGAQHESHCNDAAGTYNIIRTAQDNEAGGVCLWYLGSEDERIWDFYSQDLDMNFLRLKPFNYKQLEFINLILSVNYDGVKGEILDMINIPDNGHAKINYNKNDQLITGEKYLDLPSSYLLKRYGSSNPKKIALTFDDGPNSDYTPKILDILKKKKVPATFFVIGANIQNNIPIIRREYNEGHEIGNHTYTHPNLELTTDNRERIELRSTRLLLESILNHTTLLFRAPYITDAEPTSLSQIKSLAIANSEGFISVTAYIDTNDWEEDVSADTIVARAIKHRNDGNIILMHDAGGDRNATVKALPQIIDAYRKLGFQFVTVSDLMGKTRDQVMPPVQSKFKFYDTLDVTFFTLIFIWDHFLDGFFFVAIVLIIFRLLLIGFLAVLQHYKEKRRKVPSSDYQPKVSVIVPAYNEEMNAVRTVDYLLKSSYYDFEVIFVDDGSKDATFDKINTAYKDNLKVKLFSKPNGGKAAALNFGIEHSSGEILVCIDADTILQADAISKMIPIFADSKVGAVAGNVRVGNTLNMLTQWQSIEYTTSQNFDRRAFDAVNAILVVPGAIGAFRKTAMEVINGFTTDTLAEDCDLTLRMLRAGFVIRSCNEALALTEAPETVNNFMRQRSRWSFGMMQSFWKNRDLLFSFKKPNIGWIALPNLLIFNFIIPIFSPLVDILFIIGLFFHDSGLYIFFYLLYYFLDCIISSLAYYYDHQNFTLKKALYLFVQRFVYRQILFVVLFKAYIRAIKGELVSWGVIKRTGNVKE